MAILVPGFYEFWGLNFEPNPDRYDESVEPEAETTMVTLWLDERGHISGHRVIYKENRLGKMRAAAEYKLVEGAWSLQGEILLDFESEDEPSQFTGYVWYDGGEGTWTNQDNMEGGTFMWITAAVQSFYLDQHFETISSFLETYHTNRPISACTSPRSPKLTLQPLHSRHSFLIQAIGSERQPQFWHPDEVSTTPRFGDYLSVNCDVFTPASPLTLSPRRSSNKPPQKVSDMSLLSVNATTIVDRWRDKHQRALMAAMNFIPDNHPAQILIQDVITLYRGDGVEIGVKFLSNRVLEVYDLLHALDEHIGEGTWDIHGRCFFEAKYNNKFLQFVGCSDGHSIIGELTVSLDPIQNKKGKVINPGRHEQFVVHASVPIE